MRSTIETYKESLSRITSDVLDDDKELEEVLGSRSQRRESSSSLPERRSSSRRFSRFVSPGGSPVPNGVDSVASSEVDLLRDDIRRVQASEAEMKAPISYIAMLKEKEAQISILHEEISSLKRSLEAKNATAHVLGEGCPKTIKNDSIANKETVNQSPNKQNRHSIEPFSIGNGVQKENIQNQDIFGHGNSHATLAESQQDIDMGPEYVLGNEKELLSAIQVNSNAFIEVRANLESEIKHLKAQLEHEREISSDLKLKSQDVYNLNETSKNEIKCMKLENERSLFEMKEMQKQLEAKNSEIKQLQLELSRIHSHANTDDSLENLRKANEALRKENAMLKVEKDKVESAMELSVKSSIGKSEASLPQVSCKDASSAEKEKEELLLSIQKLEKTLKDTYTERDKAQRELARLKEHLLDKEHEESDKMDEDSKIIEELRGKFEHQKVHILKLEKALKNEVAKREEIKNLQRDELQKLNEINKDLKQKLANSMSLVDSKNVELLNLQTALGQYYAESEAKERLERNLAAAREESTNLSKLLEIAKLDLEKSNKDKEELVSKLSHTEMMLSDAKLIVKKLQEDNSKLHRAVEQSMTRLNRMSMDSDFYVDRRIVIKLLVTYFQRNHSKEVLDLMVRMLGFSDEDKRRIGFAQQAAGKTVVRGVLGLPGRLVGGILGGRSPEAISDVPSENQSFAALWVDFLLKDAEQREKQEKEEAEGTPSSIHEKSSTNSGVISRPPGTTTTPTFTTSFPTVHSSYTTKFSSPLSKQSLSETDAEFANVPLTSSVSPRSGNSSRFSTLLPKF